MGNEDLFEAAKKFAEEQGEVPTRYAFEQGAKWQKNNHQFARFANEECWIWQGDGKDQLETLTCPVVISADDLMQLIANQQAKPTDTA